MTFQYSELICSSIRNRFAYANEANMVNKDSPFEDCGIWRIPWCGHYKYLDTEPCASSRSEIVFCWCDRSILRIVVGIKHLPFSCFSASTRKRNDPFAYACTYACIKAIFAMKLDLLCFTPVKTRFKKCFNRVFYCITYFFNVFFLRMEVFKTPSKEAGNWKIVCPFSTLL